MKAIKKCLKTIALFFTALMLFQSCVVYQKTPTNLEQASLERINTKVTNVEGETTKYKYITFEDGIYYGVNRDYDVPGKLVKTPLSEQEITKVFMKNKSASTLVTVGVIALPLLTITFLIAYASAGPGNPFPSGF